MKRLLKELYLLLWPFIDKLLFPTLKKFPWLLPDRSRFYLMHRIEGGRFNRYMTGKIGHFIGSVNGVPVGSKETILRTSIMRPEDVERQDNLDEYFMSGYEQMLDWMQLLERHSFNLRTARAIMEFGCGSARLICHLRCIDGVRLIGCDLNRENVAWSQQNIPGVEFYLNDLRPPLSFAENDSLDLVFAASVFTHIPLETQHLWIQEMYRILRPGGFFLADVLGHYHQKMMLSPDDLDSLRKEGQFTLDATNPNSSHSTQIIGSWDVFQTRKEVLNAFGSVFHIHDYLPRGLDLLVLQKRPGV